MKYNDHLVSNDDRYTTETFFCTGQEIRANLMRWLKQTNLVHLSIYRGDHLLLSVPITFSAILISGYPFLSLLTTAYLLKHHFTIKIQKAII